MKIIAKITFVAALFAAQATFAQAPGSPGTAGAGNAAATSGAGGTPSQPGTGPGQTNPGNTNVPLPPEPSAPAANPNQVPSGGSVKSTTPPAGGRPVAPGSTVGQSGRTPRLQDPKQDPVVQQSEEEVSKRIKNICKGC